MGNLSSFVASDAEFRVAESAHLFSSDTDTRVAESTTRFSSDANMKFDHSATLPTQSRLLSLPGELRRVIYNHMTPLHAQISEYRGLDLACKQTYREFRAQAFEQMNQILQDVEMRWLKFSNTPLQISQPKTLSDLEQVIVTLPESFFRDNFRSGCWNMKPLLLITPGVPIGPLSGLLKVHLDRLEFSISEFSISDELYTMISTKLLLGIKDSVTEISKVILERRGEVPQRGHLSPRNFRSLQADELVFKWGNLGVDQVMAMIDCLDRVGTTIGGTPIIM